MAENLPEPWLRGPVEAVHPLVMPVFYTFTQVREELPQHVTGLTVEQVWTRPLDAAAPVGYHLRHLAGSADRLTTYLMGQQLTSAQMDFLRHEADPGAGAEELLWEVNALLRGCEERLRTVKPESLYEPRGVGRRALPSTVLGLIVHISEHTQRHLGQAITTAKIIRQRS